MTFRSMIRQTAKKAAQTYQSRAISETSNASTASHSLTVRTPYTKRICGDNAAMIGVAAASVLATHASAQHILQTREEIKQIERLPGMKLE